MRFCRGCLIEQRFWRLRKAKRIVGIVVGGSAFIDRKNGVIIDINWFLASWGLISSCRESKMRYRNKTFLIAVISLVHVHEFVC